MSLSRRFVGTFALVPGQSLPAIGAEVLITALACWATVVHIQRKAPRDPGAPKIWMISRVAAMQLATLPMVVGGASLLAERGGGFYWTVGGVIASFFAALVDAWVLLVEIQR